jgi:hypothetical protein
MTSLEDCSKQGILSFFCMLYWSFNFPTLQTPDHFLIFSLSLYKEFWAFWPFWGSPGQLLRLVCMDTVFFLCQNLIIQNVSDPACDPAWQHQLEQCLVLPM